MAGLKPIDLTELNAAVAEAVGVFASVEAYIDGVAAKMAAAVTAALEADNAADQGSIDVAQAAIATAAAELKAKAQETAAALTANTQPTP